FKRMLCEPRLPILLSSLLLSVGCIGTIFQFSADAGVDGVDVGDSPDLSGVFGVDDAGRVAQVDLAGVARYHPSGFADAIIHGPELKLQRQDCRTCHGADLKGGSSAVSCDGCHTSGWRTHCVFCHGGANGDTSG